MYVLRKWQLQVDCCKTEEEICTKIPSSPALPLELLLPQNQSVIVFCNSEIWSSQMKRSQQQLWKLLHQIIKKKAGKLEGHLVTRVMIFPNKSSGSSSSSQSWQWNPEKMREKCLHSSSWGWQPTQKLCTGREREQPKNSLRHLLLLRWWWRWRWALY